MVSITPIDDDVIAVKDGDVIRGVLTNHKSHFKIIGQSHNCGYEIYLAL